MLCDEDLVKQTPKFCLFTFVGNFIFLMDKPAVILYHDV